MDASLALSPQIDGVIGWDLLHHCANLYLQPNQITCTKEQYSPQQIGV